ncbi:hypothetical protein [Clostridium tarantellae]|uniref:Uncharacterized protein n=1 Tax=Clostridium tarantellae TaxID=39493 RepID=A0A6I1MRD6_9CLOT|nr:hypothetical protein [Clostridium tarantellae]MPQ45353.1 hypothetical protein [Clostridium tarantellae]
MRDIKEVLKEILEEYHLIPKDTLFIDGVHYEQDEMEEFLTDLSTNEAYIEEVFIKHDKRLNKKLTAEQVEQIKNDSRSYRVLAKEYYVATGTISKIKNNKY